MLKREPCQAKTYYCRDTPIKNEHRDGVGQKTGITYEAYACKNTSLMGHVIKKLQSLGWKQADDALNAAFIMDDGISFMVASHGRAGNCEHNADVRMQVIGAFHDAPEICQKFSLLRALRKMFAKTRRLATAEGLAPGSEFGDDEDIIAMEAMFDTWSFIPRTYEMSEMYQRLLLFRHVPCSGANTDWLIKQDTHGGRGIIEIETYEELRRKFLDPEEDECVKELDKVGHGGNESDDLLDRINSLNVAFRGGSRQRFRASLDQGRDIVQQIVRPLLWDGNRFVARVFFAALRTGRTWQRPSRPPSGYGVVDMWDIGSGRYDLFMFDAPYFMRHPGLVSDHSHSAVEALNASTLDAYIGSLPEGPTWPQGYVKSVFMPSVERMTRLCWEASEKSDSSGDVRTQIEPDGSYQLFAGDFLISSDFQVKMLEFSSGMALDHMRHGDTASLLDELALDTARLFTREFSLKGGPREEKGTNYARWRKISERPLLPHP
jgi:hypothetical protein